MLSIKCNTILSSHMLIIFQKSNINLTPFKIRSNLLFITVKFLLDNTNRLVTCLNNNNIKYINYISSIILSKNLTRGKYCTKLFVTQIYVVYLMNSVQSIFKFGHLTTILISNLGVQEVLSININ